MYINIKLRMCSSPARAFFSTRSTHAKLAFRTRVVVAAAGVKDTSRNWQNKTDRSNERTKALTPSIDRWSNNSKWAGGATVRTNPEIRINYLLIYETMSRSAVPKCSQSDGATLFNETCLLSPSQLKFSFMHTWPWCKTIIKQMAVKYHSYPDRRS